MTVIAQAPLRIGLAGSGTDLPAYADRFGGLVLVVSTTIDRYVYVIIIDAPHDVLQITSDESCVHLLGRALRGGGVADRSIENFGGLYYMRAQLASDLTNARPWSEPVPISNEWGRAKRRPDEQRDNRSGVPLDKRGCVALPHQKALVSAAGMEIRSHLVPIGIDVQEQPAVEFNPNASRLLSVATMHYPPNVEAIRWFRDTIWPAVRAACPVLEVDIVGLRPPNDLLSWPLGDARIHVHGYVRCVDPLYEEAAVFIVPLQVGSGVRVKILEAMACVVSTSIGVDGLDLVDGEHLRR